MYSRGTELTTNQTATRNEMSRERNILSEYLPILILTLTKSTAEENENENRAPCFISFKPKLKT